MSLALAISNSIQIINQSCTYKLDIGTTQVPTYNTQFTHFKISVTRTI